MIYTWLSPQLSARNSSIKSASLLVCAEAGAAEPLGEVLTGLDKDAVPAFIVGPEGGFSARELETLARCPFVRLVGLGPRVLRAETAALAALACWQSICGDWAERPAHRQGTTV